MMFNFVSAQFVSEYGKYAFKCFIFSERPMKEMLMGRLHWVTEAGGTEANPDVTSVQHHDTAAQRGE